MHLKYFRGEPCSSKVRNFTEDIPPSWAVLTTNEVLFAHTDESSGKLLRGACAKLGKNMGKEHLEALRARLIECYFHRRGVVDEDVFLFKISLDQAKSALAALVMKEFKPLQHPLNVPSSTLIPSVLQGLEACHELAPKLLNISNERYQEDIEKLKVAYRNNICDKIENDDLLDLLSY